MSVLWRQAGNRSILCLSELSDVYRNLSGGKNDYFKDLWDGTVIFLEVLHSSGYALPMRKVKKPEHYAVTPDRIAIEIQPWA